MRAQSQPNPMCHLSDLIEIEERQMSKLQSNNEQNTIDTSLKAQLEKTVALAPSAEFNNWLNQDGPKNEYIEMLHAMRDHGAQPGSVRYLMQYAFQAGLALRPEVHKCDRKIILCSECGIYTEHERFSDPANGFEGFNCCGCDEHTDYDLALHREYQA